MGIKFSIGYFIYSKIHLFKNLLLTKGIPEQTRKVMQ